MTRRWCAVAVNLVVAVGLRVFLLFFNMRCWCCPLVHCCTATDVLLHNCCSCSCCRQRHIIAVHSSLFALMLTKTRGKFWQRVDFLIPLKCRVKRDAQHAIWLLCRFSDLFVFRIHDRIDRVPSCNVLQYVIRGVHRAQLSKRPSARGSHQT